MAANDSQSKRGGAQSGSRPRRKRAVIIDLPGDSVAEGKSARPHGQPGPVPVSTVGEAPAATATPSRTEQSSAAASGQDADVSSANSGISPPPRQASGFNMLAFAAIGALVVLLGGYLLMFTDLMPPPGRETAETALSETERLTEEIEALRRDIAGVPTNDMTPLADRIAALEQIAGGLTGLRELVDALAVDIQSDRDARLVIVNDLEGLRRELVAAAATAGDPQAAARLSEEIGQLSQRLAAMENAGPSTQMLTLQQQLDRLDGEVIALAEEAEALAADAVDRDRAEGAARALALSNLQASAGRGDGFAAELAALAQLGADPGAVAALEPAALGRVASTAELAADFGDVAVAILDAAHEADPNAGFWERFWDNARGVVVVQPTVPIEADTPPAIISRMQAAVDAGDLEAALAERVGLPETSLAALAGWASRAEERLALDAAIAALAEAVLRQQAE